MLILSVFLSTLLLGVAYLITRIGKWYGCAVAFCLGGAVLHACGLPCFAILPGAILAGLLGAAACLVGGVTQRVTHRPPRFFGWSLIACFVVSQVAAVLWSIPRIRERMELRDRYPVESLADRLAFEEEHRAVEHLAETGIQSALSTPARLSAVQENLSQLESRIFGPYSYRRTALMRLHDGVVADFIDSPGFGISRQLPPNKYSIDLPEVKPTPLPYPEFEPDSGGESPGVSVGKESPKNVPQDKQLKEFYQNSVFDFVNAEGFGYIRDREHVRGFQSHQFRAMPEFSTMDKSMTHWKVENLQLISLLKFAEPRVYLSTNLPRMDELRHSETRLLDSFEKSSLPELQAGEDLKINYAQRRIRMLGSIRAINECLECHHAKRGDLLGAFTYTLVPKDSGP